MESVGRRIPSPRTPVNSIRLSVAASLQVKGEACLPCGHEVRDGVRRHLVLLGSVRERKRQLGGSRGGWGWLESGWEDGSIHEAKRPAWTDRRSLSASAVPLRGGTAAAERIRRTARQRLRAVRSTPSRNLSAPCRASRSRSRVATASRGTRASRNCGTRSGTRRGERRVTRWNSSWPT